MDIKKEVVKNQTVLLIMPSADYNKEVVSIVKKLSGKTIAYISLNKTRDSLVELFKKNKVKMETIVFVDAISKTIKDVPDTSTGVYYVSSPGALTEISTLIASFLRHKFDYLIFDSLTSLLVYQNKDVAGKFIASISKQIKENKTHAIFYVLPIKEQEDLIKKSGSVVDKVISL